MAKEINWIEELTPGDREIVHRIAAHFSSDLLFLEKVRRARLLAVMDLEFDPVEANRGKIKAKDVLRVADIILSSHRLG